MPIGKLKNATNLATTLAAALVAMAATPALADVYIPEGPSGTALQLSGDFAPVGRIKGLGNTHGMDVALSRGILISATLDEQSRGEMKVKKPEGMSDSAHKAHHGGGMKGNKASDTVSLISLIDIKTGKITRKIEVPGMVHHVTVGANDRYVLATHPGLDAISIIDLETDKVTATIKTGPNPNYAVYDPQTRSFWVSNAGNATISQVDPVQGYVVRNVKTPAGAEHLAIDTSGRRLFAAEADAGTLSVVDLDSGKVTRTYNIGGELHGVAYDPKADAVYVSAREQGKVAWVDLASGTVTTTPIGPEPYHMALANGRLVVSSAEKDVVWVVDVASRKTVRTVPTSATAHQMAVIPES